MKQSVATFKVISLFLVLVFYGNVFAGAATKWVLDKAHTSVNFNIKHFLTTVTGRFDDYNIEFYFDPDNLEGSSINVTIQVASINTGHETRDGHLITKDWFDAEKYPVMSFNSSKIISEGDGEYIAKGKLKIKDIEKNIELPFKLLGVKKIPDRMKHMFSGHDEVASFEASYTLNRKDFNIGEGESTKGEAADMYREFVGNKVNINIAVEVDRKNS
jgi:polyisoprenoid-binding protein YceI